MLKKLSVALAMTLGAVNAALAQATPPAGSGAPATPAADGGGTPWLWIIIALLIVAALVWYFMRGRSRATTAGTTSTSSATTSRTADNQPHVYDNKTRK
jgi:bacteriorhodopsin